MPDPHLASRSARDELQSREGVHGDGIRLDDRAHVAHESVRRDGRGQDLEAHAQPGDLRAIDVPGQAEADPRGPRVNGRDDRRRLVRRGQRGLLSWSAVKSSAEAPASEPASANH